MNGQQYLVIKTNTCNLQIRISFSGDNYIRMEGKAYYKDGRENQSVDEAIKLDDPNRNQKLLDLWNTFKTVISDEMAGIFTSIEGEVTEYLNSIEN